jgi:hypothetical protein
MYRDGIDINNEVRDEVFGEYVDELLQEKEALALFKGKIEAFLEALEQKEKTKEQQRHKNNQPRAYSTKIPKDFFEHPLYHDLKEVIITPQKERIIPRRWEELQIDFSDKNRRYSGLCDRYVYRVTNRYNYRKLLDKKVALAIPIQTVLFQEIQKEYEKQIEIYRFVQISRRMMQEVGYREKEDLQSCMVAEVLEDIRTFIKGRTWVSWCEWIETYKKFGINLEMFIKKEMCGK